ncbi:MAG: DEAD/DEAH box helicase family protein, partial [Tissierellales bacterium]|nr:DEAD/DEAH box helicase family protein [Tissierellales bacterium]
MEKILNEYCHSQCEPGLLLLSMPTGFGKTYKVLNFIYANYKEFAAQERKILFVTNLKKNLPFQELKKRFIDDGKEDEFTQHALFIDSNSGTVIDHLLAIDHEIPDHFKTSTYSQLKSYIETLSQNKELPENV